MSDEVQLIKERLDLADLIGEYLPLKRYGGHWKGLCPFHQEKTPSFIVSPDKNIYHCFGCGESGDHFTFMQRVEGLDFVAALKMLAERAGVTLQPRTGSAPARDERTQLFELLDVAAKFYHEILVHQKAGEKARAYLRERGMKEETRETFQIGYAPNGWDTVQKFLRRRGFATEALIASGLVGKSDRGKLFDRFRGRIMFPIHDVQGRVVAFGGRITPWHATGQEGKYVNSPETAIYHKRAMVYNLHRAKQAIRQQQRGIVVEGYMDVAMLVQTGIPNVVASSGTAFTPEQIQQLARFTNSLHFAFDADTAGLKAGITATATALSAGMRVATLLFPGGKDPADVALATPEKIPTYINQPQSLVRVLLGRLQATNDAAGREALLTEVLPLIKQVRNVVQQGEMIQEVAELLHVPERLLHEQLARIPLNALAPDQGAPPMVPAPSRLTPEQYAAGLLLTEPMIRQEWLPQLPVELFTHEEVRQVVSRLNVVISEDATRAGLSADELITSLGEAYLPLAEALRVATLEERAAAGDSPQQEIAHVARILRRRFLERRLKELQAQLSGGGGTVNPESWPNSAHKCAFPWPSSAFPDILIRYTLTT